MKTNKQDLVHTRTASALEQKLGARKKFSEVLGQLDDTRDDIELLKAYLDDKLKNVYSEITRTATEITQKVEALDTNVKAELKLKVGVYDNDQVVSMINASADVIELKSNRLIVESDKFSISEDGTIEATSGLIGGLQIEAERLRSPDGAGVYGSHKFTFPSGTSQTFTGYLFYAFSPFGTVAKVNMGDKFNGGTMLIDVLLNDGTTVVTTLLPEPS